MQIPSKIYVAHLTTINDIPFTNREIDIMAFLISGRSAKKIAAFFKISPKTVEYHTGRIMQKLSCNSRESIIDFVEKSPQYAQLQAYHSSLTAEGIFEDLLKKLPLIVETRGPVYVWATDHQEEAIAHLKKHLNLVGFKISAIPILEVPQFSSTALGTQEGTLIQLDPPQPITEESPTLFIERSVCDPQTLQQLKAQDSFAIEVFDLEDYYAFVISILNAQFSKSQVGVLFHDFIKHQRTPFSLTQSPKKTQPIEINWTGWLPNFNRKYVYIGLAIFVLGLIASTPFWMENATSPKLASGLTLPPDHHLLHRKVLLSSVHESFKAKPHKIHITLLLGIGGSGKTTLARQFARSRKAWLVWEINAETKDTLIKSFEDLAHAISSSENDTMTLQAIANCPNGEEREDKLFGFIKDKLKQRPNWFLIYDNVDNLPIFQKHIPHDEGSWGIGSVLITSRDRNIQMNNAIHQTVEVGELTDPEKLSLLLMIMGKKPFKKSEEKERVVKFLNEIPPFPLDVALAAKYLMTTNVSYDEYVKSLAESKQDFVDLQNTILEDSGPYNINRPHIIALTLDKILAENPDFASLLLFITLVDSQNIPRDLLTRLKDSVIVDKFMYHAKKYSLISGSQEFSNKRTTTSSIHRTIQKIFLSYLKKTFKADEIRRFLSEISWALEDYTTEAIHQENASRFLSLIPHCESFLENLPLLSSAAGNPIQTGLGWIYGYLGDFDRAKRNLEQSLNYLKLQDQPDLKRVAKALSYLGNVYLELGDYSQAKDLFFEAKGIFTNHLTDHGEDIAWIHTYLGHTYRCLGNYDLAKESLESGRQAYKTHAPNNPMGVAKALGFLGDIHMDLGQFDAAAHLLEESRQIYTHRFPNNHMDLAKVLLSLGIANKELGHREKSFALLEEGLHLYQKHLPLTHTNVAWVLGDLGCAYLDIKEMSKAKDTFENNLKNESRDSLLRVFIDLSNPLFTSQTATNTKNTSQASSTFLGYNYRNLGDYVRTRDSLKEYIQLYQSRFPQNHIGIARDLAFLGRAHLELGNYQKALALLERCKRYYVEHFPENNLERAKVLLDLGITYKELDQPKPARYALEEGINIYRKELPLHHITVAESLGHLGVVYLKENKLDEAKATFAQSIQLFQENNRGSHIKT